MMLGFVQVPAAPQQSSPVTRVVPSDGRFEFYFKSIDRLTEGMKLKPLRSLSLKPGDVELRVWEMANGDSGYVIRRTANKWSAVAGDQFQQTKPRLRPVPTSTDWAAVWERLERDGIGDLRDDSERGSCNTILDGVAYVVEIAREKSYRTYNISNPRLDRSEDGDRFLRLLPTLYGAFRGERTEIDPRSDPAKLPTGEVKTVVSAVAAATLGVTAPPIRAWRSATGATTERAADIQLAPDEALAEATDLRTPQCQELPVMFRLIRSTEDVVVELLIEPNGKVLATRARSNRGFVGQTSEDIALKWTFRPLVGRNELRSAMLTVRYQQEWVPFPWLKTGK